MKKSSKSSAVAPRASKRPNTSYPALLRGVVSLIQQSRLTTARSINLLLTSTYWLIGRQIVEHEQSGAHRAGYGEALLERLGHDLTARLGRGFSMRNLRQMRSFYLTWPNRQTVSAEFTALPIRQTVSAESPSLPFPLPWSHYVRLLSVSDSTAREYYERESLRGGWSARQLDRQIASLAFQRTRGTKSPAIKQDALHPDVHLRDPFILEFLNLKDEYSETDLEDSLIQSLEHFLLELGNDFTFLARQKRLRVGTEWYRVDLVFFHRRLRCLVIVDLKLGKFTHSDAGQMNLYLNYAREHWTHAHENPPIGLILCSESDAAVAHYALGHLDNQVLAREYRLNLPNPSEIAVQMERARRRLLSPSSGTAKNAGRAPQKSHQRTKRTTHQDR